MDKSGTNYAGIENINRLLMLAGLISFIEICQVKYLNNVVSQKTQYNPLFSLKVNNSFYKCTGVGGYND
jgi:transposase-like protein